MTFRPMPVLTVLTLASLIILILLGNWQYERYTDKLTNPDAAEQAETSQKLRVEIDLAHPGNVQQVYGFADSEPIWRRYAPGQIEGTGETVLVMVEATGGAQPIPALISTLPDSITLDGLIAAKSPSSSAFSGRDDPDADLWYTLDRTKLADRLGLAEAPRVVEPIVMSVRNASDLSQSRQTLNPYAFSRPVDPLPPERHFGYALTWWGMALGLIGVYVALHHSRGRLRFKKA
ncbi:MAG: SURF1 family cytochrome oxidase biogenesis protein [Pseudomonadota bacterium]